MFKIYNFNIYTGKKRISATFETREQATSYVLKNQSVTGAYSHIIKQVKI